MSQTPVNKALSFFKRLRLKRQRNRFNATSTYARFSDVPTPYFAGICRDADVADQPMTSISDRLLSKDRAVAWFATHCSTSSRRERYNIAPCAVQQTHPSRRPVGRLQCRVVTRCSHVIAQYVVPMGTRLGAVQKLSECHLNHDAFSPAVCTLARTSIQTVGDLPLPSHPWPPQTTFLVAVYKPSATDVFFSKTIKLPFLSSELRQWHADFFLPPV